MKLLLRLGALALGLIPCAASAQSAGSSVQFPAGYATGQSPCVKQADGSCLPVSATTPLPVASAATAVTGADGSGTVTTSGVFQPLQAANPARKGCTVQNTSTVAEQLRQGTTVWTLMPGQPFNCASGNVVATDAIAITSATAGAQFSAVFQ